MPSGSSDVILLWVNRSGLVRSVLLNDRWMGGADVRAGPSGHASPLPRQAGYVVGKREMSEKGTADKAAPLDLFSMEDHG
jgi:hypothetical protein